MTKPMWTLTHDRIVTCHRNSADFCFSAIEPALLYKACNASAPLLKDTRIGDVRMSKQEKLATRKTSVDVLGVAPVCFVHTSAGVTMGWLTDNSVRFNEATHDAHGQPINPMFRAHAVQDRQVDELIGLVKGVLADGAICQGEIQFLLKWMETNRVARSEWPARALYPRIAEALSDGHMDEREEAEIMALLLSAVGGNKAVEHGESSDSSDLPLCAPAPEVTFHGHTFCFTGKFTSGTRDWCQQQVHNLGGIPLVGVTKKLNYLVIGDIGSRDWLHSTHGTKIKKAMAYRDDGVRLSIVSEEHWFKRLELAA